MAPSFLMKRLNYEIFHRNADESVSLCMFERETHKNTQGRKTDVVTFTYPIILRSEYCFLLLVRLKKVRLGGMTVGFLSKWYNSPGCLVIRMPHDARYLNGWGEMGEGMGREEK